MLENLNDSSYLELPKDERDYVYKCDICDKEIFEGYNCYEIDSLIYCHECMKMHFKVIAISMDTQGYLSDL